MHREYDMFHPHHHHGPHEVHGPEWVDERRAPSCDDQLPNISRVGRGLKGDGYRVIISDPDTDNATYLEGQYIDAHTGKVTTDWVSENINGGKLSYQYKLISTDPALFAITFTYTRPGRTEWSFTTPAIPFNADNSTIGDLQFPGFADLAKLLGITEGQLREILDKDPAELPMVGYDGIPYTWGNIKDYIDGQDRSLLRLLSATSPAAQALTFGEDYTYKTFNHWVFPYEDGEDIRNDINAGYPDVWVTDVGSDLYLVRFRTAAGSLEHDHLMAAVLTSTDTPGGGSTDVGNATIAPVGTGTDDGTLFGTGTVKNGYPKTLSDITFGHNRAYETQYVYDHSRMLAIKFAGDYEFLNNGTVASSINYNSEPYLNVRPLSLRGSWPYGINMYQTDSGLTICLGVTYDGYNDQYHSQYANFEQLWIYGARFDIQFYIKAVK